MNRPLNEKWKVRLIKLWHLPSLLFLGFAVNVNAGTIEVTPNTAQDFGEVMVGNASAEQTFTIKNVGTGVLNINTVDAYGNVFTLTDAEGNITTHATGNDEFVVTNDPCSFEGFMSPSTCPVKVAFKPKAVGDKRGTLAITSNDSVTPKYTVSLTGKALPAPDAQIEVTPSTYDFGSVNLGMWITHSFVVKNVGESQLKLGKITLEGAGFALSNNNSCSNRDLPPGKECVINISFSPTLEGAQTATLSVPSNSPSSPTVIISGTGFNPPPVISLNSSYDFGEVHLNTTKTGIIEVKNTGKGKLALGSVTLQGSDFNINYDYCSNQSVKEGSYCSIIINFKPSVVGGKTATLSIPSNDPSTAVASVNLAGSGAGWCSGAYEKGTYVYPEKSDYGTIVTGDKFAVYQSFYTWARGCDAFEVSDVTITGTNATEFTFKYKYCYAGKWEDYGYAYCSFSVEFAPTSQGNKLANIDIKVNGGEINPTIPLSGNAVTTAQPGMAIKPSTYDFGEATVGSWIYNYEPIFKMSNTGNVNLNIGWNPTLSANDFWAWYGCYGSYSQNGLFIKPSSECSLYGGFSPKSAGDKQATLTAGTDTTATATVTGKGTPPVDCGSENVTIESVSSGVWANANTQAGDYGYNTYYNQPSTAWKRLKNADSANYPQPNDVVLIHAGHTITAVPSTNVRALCIEEGATLESASDQQYYPYLSVSATDTIDNKGTVKGKNGSDETNASNCAGQYWWDSVGKAGCAQSGTQVYLSANGFFRNEGTIVAGHGGSGSRYGAPGGSVGIWAMNITNTDDIGFINAGRGGNITGSQSGEGGQGGAVWVWGNDSLTSDGRGILAGNGGNCNPNATEPQTGGAGGNMRLNASKSVNLLDGTFSTGKGGKNCKSGTNGRDGGFNTDPSVLNLSGANTKIEGGDVTIYGGNDWVINLTDLSDTALTATGDITLATGEGGSVNFMGSSGKVLQAGGQVLIYANQILLDEGKQLSDLIEATDIIVAPAKVLRDVTISAPPKLPATPITMLPIEIILANGSPEADTYQLSVTDTEGWNLSGIAATADVAALGNVKMTLIVAVPAAPMGTVNTITVNAISKADVSVVATAQTQVEVIEELPKATATTDYPAQNWSNMMLCPQQGTVDIMCDNRGNILTGATLTAHGTISGGQLAGVINNEGTISQVTIQEGATLKGGKVTGTITNQGTIDSVDFRGGKVVGGTLAGVITNDNDIMQKYENVHLAPHASVRGGTLQGTIVGDADAPALLENLYIAHGTELTGVVIGENVELGDNVRLGRGVRFARAEDVPNNLALNDILPLISANADCETPVLQPAPVDLSSDIVVDTAGILAAINEIPLLKDNHWQLTQHPKDGYLQLEVDGVLRFAVQPWQVKQALSAMGLQLGGQYAVSFVTDNRIQVLTQPAVQNLCYLAKELAQLALQITVKNNGNLHVATANSKQWFSVRPDWVATIAPSEADMATGLHADSLPVYLAFTDDSGELWQQAFYPAPADMDALFAAAQKVSLGTDGTISFEWQGKAYQGMLDYIVEQGEAPSDGDFQVKADGEGWLLVYPQGETQRLW